MSIDVWVLCTVAHIDCTTIPSPWLPAAQEAYLDYCDLMHKGYRTYASTSQELCNHSKVGMTAILAIANFHWGFHKDTTIQSVAFTTFNDDIQAICLQAHSVFLLPRVWVFFNQCLHCYNYCNQQEV